MFRNECDVNQANFLCLKANINDISGILFIHLGQELFSNQVSFDSWIVFDCPNYLTS